MEGVMAAMHRKHENEVADLQATADSLLKVGFTTQLWAFTLSLFTQMEKHGTTWKLAPDKFSVGLLCLIWTTLLC